MYYFSVGKYEDAIYMTFEHTSKPIYIANLECCGGDCWSVIGSDLSLPASWRSVAMETSHMQIISLHSPMFCDRFVLHLFRTGRYDFESFKRDLFLRSMF